MDKILEALVDELAKRVLEKIGEDTTTMRDFFKIKVKATDVDGLEELLDDRMDNIKGECVSAAEDATKEILDSLEVEVESTASVNHN